MKQIYYVYFQQVNQERYTVSGSSREEAILKAQKYWKQENDSPTVISVEVAND